MLSRFRVELDVVFDTANMPMVIEKARQHYAAEGTVETMDQNGTFRDMPVAEFIGEIEDALMELAERNPLFINAGLDTDRITCTTMTVDAEEENIDHEEAAEPDIGE